MSDWSQRDLCPDGACVGVIGADGKCKVCGTPASDFRPPASGEEEDEDDAVDEDEDIDEDGDEGADDDPASDPDAESRTPGAGDGDWDHRALCPDGACVGVIHEGKCNVCGRSAA